MVNNCEIDGYLWADAGLNCSHSYLLPIVLLILKRIKNDLIKLRRSPELFELGCGNGSVANEITKNGWRVLGVDPSKEGIALARNHYPHLELYEGSAYDNLAIKYGVFPVAISLEVVEHVYAPRKFAATLFSLVEPGGVAIISTPFHGYWKNLVLALSGRMDSHFTALWDHGHIKFWSIRTLTRLLNEVGFVDIKILRIGRISILAKSMIVIAQRP